MALKKIIRFSIPFIAACLMLGVLIFLVGASSQAVAAPSTSNPEGTMLVNTLEDELNSDGDCSFREAIIAANDNNAVDACDAGDPVITDTISFAVAGTIVVTSQLEVTAGGPLVIDGGEVITVSGGGTNRVLEVYPGSILTIGHMAVVDGYVWYSSGAGLLNNYGKVTIIDCTFSDNHADDNGGAIYNQGEMMIISSTISGNSASDIGGGIENSSILSIIGSTFIGNRADYGGGGISSSGTLTITESTFSGNQAFAGGGAIQFSDDLTIINSTFIENTTINNGGGIFGYYYSNLRIADSLFSDNHADNVAGGIANAGDTFITNSTFSGNSADNQVGGILNAGTMTITMSTISENTASDGAGLYNDGRLVLISTNITGNSGNTGGGLFNDGTLTITLSTFSGNSAITSGGGIVNMGSLVITDSTFFSNSTDYWGGGIYSEGSLTIANSSFYDNNANHDGGGINGITMTITNTAFSGNTAGADGGGIAIGGPSTITNSTFSGNSAVYGGGIDSSGPLNIANSTFSSNSANEGGAIVNHYHLSITNSTFFSNAAEVVGGIVTNNDTLTITNSIAYGNRASYGGGIHNLGTLTIIGSTFSDNTGIYGGCIINAPPDGNMTIFNSTFYDNAADVGGVIENSGALTIVNSTFSGNNAIEGGGITNSGDLTIANSTFSSNSATMEGGGIDNFGNTVFTNTIVANSLSGGDCFGVIIDGGHNLDSDGTCGFDPANGSLPNTDPMLGPLQDNGGPTLTHALQPDSPAIDAGDDAQCPPTDQRGVIRPIDGDHDGAAVCDIGSYEFEANYLIVTTLEDELNGDGDCSLREAVSATNSNAPVDDCGSGDVQTDIITFDVSGTITVTSQLSVTTGGPLVIDGGEVITVSGGGTTRVWWLEADSILTLQNMAINDGNADGITTIDKTGAGIFNNAGTLVIINSIFSANNAGYGAGGIYSNGSLTVTDSMFSGNTAEICGGIVNEGNLNITNTTFSGNTASYQCGGIFNGGDMIITNSTISENMAGSDGGGIYNTHTLTITNSTISGNMAGDEGGGIYNLYAININNSTFSGNSAGEGGGVYNWGALTISNSTFSSNSATMDGGSVYNYGSTVFTNTIVANSLSGGECFGATIDGGHNLDSDGSCGFDPANGSLPNTDPMLGPLQDNGGPTWTHALIWGSPAIDAGDDAQCPPTDQRGVPRPLDGDGDGLAICDMGSYEAESPPVPPTLVTITGPSEGLLGQAYIFTSTVEPISTTRPLEYVWQTSGQAPITHTGGLTDTVSFTWEAPGMQVITVTASNPGGSVTDTHEITITDVPISGLVASNDSPTLLGSLTTMSATVTAGSNIIYSWDFGDGGTGDGAVITHTYPSVGIFTATVTATNSVSSMADTTLVVITDVPIDGLSASNDSPTLLGSLTTMIATVTSGSNIIYAWDFGDGESGDGAVVMHTYPAVGIYTATITATNSVSSMADTTLVTISDVPISGLSASNDSPTLLGSLTTMIATVTAGSNIIYAWDFGDGETGTGAVVTHTYPSVGVYTATVTATNSASSLTADTRVTIITPTFDLYLPLILKPPQAPLAPASSLPEGGVLMALVVFGMAGRWKGFRVSLIVPLHSLPDFS